MELFTTVESKVSALLECLELLATNDLKAQAAKQAVQQAAGTAAGGPFATVIVRLFGDGLSRELKQPVIVENKTGASGNIAHEMVARSAPDGYTLIGTNTGPLSINKALYSKLPFDPIKDFTPIALLGYTPTLLVVRSDAQWKSLAELITMQPGTQARSRMRRRAMARPATWPASCSSR